MNAFVTYINEALEELRHVRWPTRQQAVRLSIIVLGFTAASAAIFGLIDFLLSELVQVLLSLA
jgi:preprotein translocase SecE subunit